MVSTYGNLLKLDESIQLSGKIKAIYWQHQVSREAAVCLHFSPDDEGEQIDDVSTSCFHCMKR